MDRVAVFVDAGYVFAQGSVLLAGRKLPRADISLAHEIAVKSFGDFAEKVCGAPLLRVYWYDGTSTGPTAQHLTLAHLQDVKVRLGFVNTAGAKMTLNLKTEGDAVKGTAITGGKRRDMTAEIKDGKIEGSQIRFATVNKTKKGEQKFIWTAALDGDQLRGTRAREGAKRSVPFTAKRQD